MRRIPSRTLLLSLLLVSPVALADGASDASFSLGKIRPAEAPVDFTLGAELGFVGVLSNVIQYSHSGTSFNYVSEGGENNLFPWSRLTADVTIAHRHTLVALYQPLDLNTQAVLNRDVVVDGLRFPAGTAAKLGYGFSFYRLSYLYDFDPSPDDELAVGASLQIRNASISFASGDGSLLRTNDNIGPVPIVKFRARHTFHNKLWIGTEVDGFYASGRFITGSSNDFIGSIVDASVRGGLLLTPVLDTFINFRLLAGGARGTDQFHTGPGDGFSRNWLYTFTVSLGVQLRIAENRAR